MAAKKELWKSDNWFVSWWNFLEEVTKEFKPPKQVKIHDITLRDGEQQVGILFSVNDKIRIAEKLAEVGVHRIEAGMPAASPQDEAAVREIVKRNLGSDIFVLVRCMAEDIKRAADCGVDGVVASIPCAEHMIRHAYKWPLETAIDNAIKATQLAHEQGLYTVLFPMDATRADMKWFFSFVEKVIRNGHVDALTLLDTFGVLSPHGASYFTKTLRERINIPLEIHYHNTFGLAVANTVMSVLAGAEVIHSTVNGIGEGAGSCSMVEIVLALLTLYGIDVGICYDKLTELSKLVEELSGTRAPQPIVEDDVSDIETGVIVKWYKNMIDAYPLEILPISPEFVGRRWPKIVMGKKSSRDTLTIWANKLGIELTREEMPEILAQVKQRAYDLKRFLTEDEFREIAKNIEARKR